VLQAAKSVTAQHLEHQASTGGLPALGDSTGLLCIKLDDLHHRLLAGCLILQEC
jgi:hypothetical protein